MKNKVYLMIVLFSIMINYSAMANFPGTTTTNQKDISLAAGDSLKVAILLFDRFETLDVFGPVEVFGMARNFRSIKYYSLTGGDISSSQGVVIRTDKLDDISKGVDVFMIPGGGGTRREVNNLALIEKIKQVAEGSKHVLTVCTGSALLSKTGLLDGRKATSNKLAFDWVKGNSDKVQWIRQARWVTDGKFYTSSGISAGIDMSLGFVSDLYGKDLADKTAYRMEYKWSSDKDNDDFYDKKN